jgi:hypothetical protein
VCFSKNSKPSEISKYATIVVPVTPGCAIGQESWPPLKHPQPTPESFSHCPISKQEGKLNVQVRVTLALDALYSYLHRRHHRGFAAPERRF